MPKRFAAILLLLIVIGSGLGYMVKASLPPASVAEILLPQSNWTLLSAEEQKVLKPLADKWDAMTTVEQETWRAMAKQYASRSPEEKKKLERRMTRWAAASPVQQEAARKKYKEFKEKKAAEKARLRAAWKKKKAAEEAKAQQAKAGDEAEKIADPVVNNSEATAPESPPK